MPTVSLVSDGEYAAVVAPLINAARRRVYATVFIVDPTDVNGRVDSLVDALAEAFWRRVDVRLVIGGSREVFDIATASAGSRAVMATEGIPVRWLTATPVRGSHAKVVVADDFSVVGSHNWTTGALSGEQAQESLVVESAPIADELTAFIMQQWHRSDP